MLPCATARYVMPVPPSPSRRSTAASPAASITWAAISAST